MPHKPIRSSKQDLDAAMETIFKIAPLGIGIAKNRMVVEVNAFLCRMTGYSRQELIGQSSRIFYPSDEDYDFVGREKYRQIREKGVGRVETRFITRDGAVLNIKSDSGETALDWVKEYKAKQIKAFLDKKNSNKAIDSDKE